MKPTPKTPDSAAMADTNGSAPWAWTHDHNMEYWSAGGKTRDHAIWEGKRRGYKKFYVACTRQMDEHEKEEMDGSWVIDQSTVELIVTKIHDAAAFSVATGSPKTDAAFDRSMACAGYCFGEMPKQAGWMSVACDMRDLARKQEEEIACLKQQNAALIKAGRNTNAEFCSWAPREVRAPYFSAWDAAEANTP